MSHAPPSASRLALTPRKGHPARAGSANGNRLLAEPALLDLPPQPDWRLVFPAAFTWLSAWAATQWPEHAWLLVGILTVVCAAGIVTHRRPLALAVALAAAAGMLVAGLAAAQASGRTPASVADAAASGEAIVYTATTTTMASDGTRGKMYRATLTSHADAPILLFVPPEAETQPIGTALRFEATVKLSEPGSDVVAFVFVRGVVTPLAPPHPLLQLTNGIREGFVEIARALPSPGAMLLPGLAVGDETLVDEGLDAAMKTSSLTHLTAVSGSNIAIVVAALIALGRFLGWSRPVRCAAAVAGLACFVALVTPQGSVIRASVMALIVLMLEAFARPVFGVPVLSLAVIILLTVDPWLSHDYGFALSAAATAGLLLGSAPLARFFGRWLPASIAALIAVPTVAQVACQPVLLLLDPSIPLYGVAANLLAAPAAPLATVVGLLACLSGLVVPPIGAALVWVAWAPAQWIAMIALAAGQLPAASLPWLPGGHGALAWIALCAAVVVVARRGGGARWRLVRRFTAAALAVVLIAVCAWSVGRFALRVRDLPSDWRLLACDVGQGDALVLRAGEAMVLIDTGEDASLLAKCLDEFDVDRIDVLLLSHFDRDHAGAAGDIPVPVGEVWLPDTHEAREESLTVRLQAVGVPVRFVANGDEFVLSDLTISALSPERSGDGGPAESSGNDGSLAVRATPTERCASSCFSTLFLGDLGERAQAQLDTTRLDVDVVKMSHHGSADQSAQLYRSASAKLAIVSVGVDNGYGHPTKRALEVLTAASTPWLRTDESGAIAVFTNGNKLAAWTAK